MIKSDLIDAIREELGGVSSREVWEYVTFILEDIGDALEHGETVKLTNFGVFDVHQKRERMGRNPKTLEEAAICARRVVRFRNSEKLHDILNPED